VVARSAHRVRRQQGDHKGRPYIQVAFHDAPIPSVWLTRATSRGKNRADSLSPDPFAYVGRSCNFAYSLAA